MRLGDIVARSFLVPDYKGGVKEVRHDQTVDQECPYLYQSASWSGLVLLTSAAHLIAGTVLAETAEPLFNPSFRPDLPFRLGFRLAFAFVLRIVVALAGVRRVETASRRRETGPWARRRRGR